MEYTKNLKLKKPKPEEFYDVQNFNDNAEAIDIAYEQQTADINEIVSTKYTPISVPDESYMDNLAEGQVGLHVTDDTGVHFLVYQANSVYTEMGADTFITDNIYKQYRFDTVRGTIKSRTVTYRHTTINGSDSLTDTTISDYIDMGGGGVIDLGLTSVFDTNVLDSIHTPGNYIVKSYEDDDNSTTWFLYVATDTYASHSSPNAITQNLKSLSMNRTYSRFAENDYTDNWDNLSWSDWEMRVEVSSAQIESLTSKINALEARIAALEGNA